MDTIPDATSWATTTTEYSLEDVEFLQRAVSENGGLWYGLAEFHRQKRPKDWNESLFTLWGPMAERMAKGEDVASDLVHRASRESFVVTELKKTA